MAKSAADNYKGSGLSKGGYQKAQSLRGKAFPTPKKKAAPKKKTPVYKSGMLANGQPRNYGTSKRGTITSLD